MASIAVNHNLKLKVCHMYQHIKHMRTFNDMNDHPQMVMLIRHHHHHVHIVIMIMMIIILRRKRW